MTQREMKTMLADAVAEGVKAGLALKAAPAVDAAIPAPSATVNGKYVVPTPAAKAAKDPWQIASIISTYVQGKNFDLIFTGMQSQDRGSAQVGVTVAEQLGFACTTTIVGFDYADGTVTAKRELEGGIKGVVKLKTPALVTCQLGLNVPRYPTLPNIMKAKRKEITAIPVADLLTADLLATTTSFHPPAKKGGGIVLEGDVGELVDKVIAILKDKTAVLR